jgi:Meiotically up-regulated gene 113
MGFVYFIGPEALFHRDPDDDEVKVKIGFTRNNPHSRLAALQCGSPVWLDLIAYIDGTPELERAYHEAFAELRAHGEWFYLHHKLRDFLGYLYPDNYKDQRYVDRARLTVCLYDTVFARSSSHPSMTDEDYCKTTDPRWLIEWYPEVCEA